MSESTGQARPEPDFLDRLIARHAAPAAAPRPGVVRVQPRLPGPFERIEAVRGTGPDADDTEPLWPVTVPSPAPRDDRARPALREVRTERERTVVRTEQTPAPEEPAPRPAALRVPQAPLLRPAAPLTPGQRPVPDAAHRAAGRGRTERDATPSAAPVPVPPGTDAASRAAVSAPLVPSTADTAAARDAVRQAAARRPGRQAEQVVQVQIGRLEVTAAGTSQGGGRPRPRGTERPQATLSLAEYLAAKGRE
ncbi:hypothetical protein [Streptomyces sp. TRM68367]|uniref:hypothetical protein n=1 Tax=Streptomyces sp. TRM68367 TaxID=2758415 RepID=UPI00165AD12D|nr:hypothetical protein [Streptomyces sp. TRM68367]MBC9728843.1 hypothetical protein [Streptomyces sp. TRM68367]